ncbi:MAG: hypothetical protein Q8930_06510 [Bacillota bacterium]|nr:hypothetical protein [Bacillota bacterium]
MKKSELYFYTINYPKYEESLARLEIRYLFGREPQDKHIFSDFYIPTSRSAFIKECISVIYSGGSLEDIVHQIERDKLQYDNFKVRYVKHEDDTVAYEERLKADSAVGYVIIGEAKLHDPDIVLGITHVNGRWIFGEYEKNNMEWQSREVKPYNYSNALGVRTGRALVNLAAAHNSDCRLVDPCCGIGTVVMEAQSMGLSVKGFEINPLIGENAKKNLEYFGFRDVITIGDMHYIKENFDTAIVDLPYGLFNPTTLETQVAIMKTARRISDRAIIVTMENMDEHIRAAGFDIVDRCFVTKGKFTRYISICK